MTLNGQGKEQGLENIFDKEESSRRKRSFGLFFIIITSFISGIIGTYIGFNFLFPYLEDKGYNAIPDTYFKAENKERVIERVIEKTYVEESEITNVVSNVSGTVVSIISKTYYRGLFGQIYSQEGGGSGFIIASDGKILTNKHVVKDKASEYTVLTKDGREFNVASISLDPFSDLAVVSIVDKEGSKPKSLPVLQIGNSKNLKPGQKVIAIGNALGKYDNSVTVGVISATGRSIVASDRIGAGEELKGLIQTDAAINPGNSGGPLLDLKGEVVGINTAVASGENIGFAIPIDDVKPVLKSIEAFGEIRRAYLGLSYRLLSKDISKAMGINVDNGALLIGNPNYNILAVDPKGPAAKVGLKEGDIIVKVDAEDITETNTLFDILKKYIPGDQMTLRVYRPTKMATDLIGGDKVNSTDYIDVVLTLTEMQI